MELNSYYKPSFYQAAKPLSWFSKPPAHFPHFVWGSRPICKDPGREWRGSGCRHHHPLLDTLTPACFFGHWFSQITLLLGLLALSLNPCEHGPCKNPPLPPAGTWPYLLPANDPNLPLLPHCADTGQSNLLSQDLWTLPGSGSGSQAYGSFLGTGRREGAGPRTSSQAPTSFEFSVSSDSDSFSFFFLPEQISSHLEHRRNSLCPSSAFKAEDFSPPPAIPVLYLIFQLYCFPKPSHHFGEQIGCSLTLTPLE